MKLVIYQYTSNKNEFARIMKIVEDQSFCCMTQHIAKSEQSDHFPESTFIKIEYNSDIYIFDRFNQSFIQAVEQAIETNPFKHVPGLNYEGQFIIQEIDDRFFNPKYYTIKVNKKSNSDKYINYYSEFLEINYNQIIDDLYNHVLKH